MSSVRPTRAERDRAAAERANKEIRAAKFREHAAQPADPDLPRRCIRCGAVVPVALEEGQGLPCGH